MGSIAEGKEHATTQRRRESMQFGDGMQAAGDCISEHVVITLQLTITHFLKLFKAIFSKTMAIYTLTLVNSSLPL